jgi:transcriptional regulator with XRE-family HTH domain
MDNTTELGKKIRQIRDLKGFSQEYVASKLEVSQKYLSTIESGIGKLSLDFMKSLAQTLEVELSQILEFDAKLVFDKCTNGIFGQYNSQNIYNAFSENEKLLFEKLIEAQEVQISILNELLKSKDELIEKYKKHE